jgi:uncharacterized membrane protein YhaH (DUF805 family)
MGFVESFKHNLVKPFEGRASRSEYWWFFLWYLIIFLVPYIILMSSAFSVASLGSDTQFSQQLESTLAGVGLIVLPVIYAWMLLLFWMILALTCTGIRRLHDTDRSGWWCLISLIPLIGSIVLLVFFCLPGTSGSNRFGDDPLQPVDTTVFA